MTDRCKNITLPQTSFAGGNYDLTDWSPGVMICSHLTSAFASMSTSFYIASRVTQMQRMAFSASILVLHFDGAANADVKCEPAFSLSLKDVACGKIKEILTRMHSSRMLPSAAVAVC